MSNRTVKTADLAGQDLNRAVHSILHPDSTTDTAPVDYAAPHSSAWLGIADQAGLLCGPSPFPGGAYAAGIGSSWDDATHIQTGATRAEAALRCLVASRMGPEVTLLEMPPHVVKEVPSDKIKELVRTQFGTYGFIHAGLEITGFLTSGNTIEPYDHGRDQSPPIGYGFSVVGTGGGATAWFQKFTLDGDNVHMMITDDGGMTHEIESADRVLVGIYAGDAFSQDELLLWEQDNCPLDPETNIPTIFTQSKTMVESNAPGTLAQSNDANDLLNRTMPRALSTEGLVVSDPQTPTQPDAMQNHINVSSMADARGRRLKSMVLGIMQAMPEDDLETLQNDNPGDFWGQFKVIPSILRVGFDEWLSDHYPHERESKMAHENIEQTYRDYIDEMLGNETSWPGTYSTSEIAHANAFLKWTNAASKDSQESHEKLKAVVPATWVPDASGYIGFSDGEDSGPFDREIRKSQAAPAIAECAPLALGPVSKPATDPVSERYRQLIFPLMEAWPFVHGSKDEELKQQCRDILHECGDFSPVPLVMSEVLNNRIYVALQKAWPLVNGPFTSNSAKRMVWSGLAAGNPELDAWELAERTGATGLSQKSLPGHGPQWSWTMPSQSRSGQFGHLDRMVVVNSESRIAVEGHFHASAANKACAVLNEHEVRYGRPAIYDVRPIPQKLHGRSEEQWQKLLDEGEEARQIRVDNLPKLLRANYPSTFVVLANQCLEQFGNAQLTNWSAVHDAILSKSIGKDVRDPPKALSELLHYSPGAVTHAEQDILCARLDKLLKSHAQQQSTRPQAAKEARTSSQADGPSP